MANWIALIILAIVQGIAEWFPISSSGHLVLVSKLLGYDNTLVLDVALHLGTLMAVFVYFGKDIMNILRDVLSCKFETENGKLGLFLIVATIPAGRFPYIDGNL
jgi:undecaprenyl-diphosphatase